MPSTVQISTQSTAVGLWLKQGGEVDLSDFVVTFKFIYFKYIYTRERLLLAKSAKQFKGKGVSRSQLQCQATTALRRNSVHLKVTSIEPESSKSTCVNVREGNFHDEVRVIWILVRTSTEPQRGQNEDQREH